MLLGEIWAGDQETCALVYLSTALLGDLEKVTFLLWVSPSSLPNRDDHP